MRFHSTAGRSVNALRGLCGDAGRPRRGVLMPSVGMRGLLLRLAASLVLASCLPGVASAAGAGTVWAWGDNSYGKLGDNTLSNRGEPVQAHNLTDVVAIAAGFDHSLALKSDETAWAWGRNWEGQLGDNTQVTMRREPVQVHNLTGAVAIAAGRHHSLALKSNGTVWAWGWNDRGQLGDNTTTDRHEPVQVHNLTGVVAIAAGS